MGEIDCSVSVEKRVNWLELNFKSGSSAHIPRRNQKFIKMCGRKRLHLTKVRNCIHSVSSILNHLKIKSKNIHLFCGSLILSDSLLPIRSACLSVCPHPPLSHFCSPSVVITMALNNLSRLDCVIQGRFLPIWLATHSSNGNLLNGWCYRISDP